MSREVVWKSLDAVNAFQLGEYCFNETMGSTTGGFVDCLRGQSLLIVLKL